MKYYGVASPGGLGVFNDSERANRCYDFLRYVSIQAFNSERKAAIWAIDTYNNFQAGSNDVDTGFYGSSFDLKINKIIFKREVKEINNIEG